MRKTTAKKNVKLTITDIMQQYGVTKDQFLEAAAVAGVKMNGGFKLDEVEKIISLINTEPLVLDPTPEYPIYAQSKHNETIVEFYGLTRGKCIYTNKNYSDNKVGEYSQKWIEHTAKSNWTIISKDEAMKIVAEAEPKKDICNACNFDFNGCENPKYGNGIITECASFCPVKPDIKQDLTTEPLATEEEEQKVFDEVIKHPILTQEELNELIGNYSKGDLWYNEVVGVVQIVELMKAENPKGYSCNIDIVWYEPRDAENGFIPMVMVKELFEMAYKPYEVVYEYKYAVDTEFGETITEQRFKDDDEMLSKVRAVKNFQRLDYTKRERNA